MFHAPSLSSPTCTVHVHVCINICTRVLSLLPHPYQLLPVLHIRQQYQSVRPIVSHNIKFYYITLCNQNSSVIWNHESHVTVIIFSICHIMYMYIHVHVSALHCCSNHTYYTIQHGIHNPFVLEMSDYFKRESFNGTPSPPSIISTTGHMQCLCTCTCRWWACMGIQSVLY